MLNDMSEAQRSILQGGARREDHFLQPPANGRGAVVKSAAGKLIDAGWAREIMAPSGAPVWRKDATKGDVFTLKLTAKGLRAVAVVRIPTNPATHSNRKPATDSDLKPAGIPI